jgi:hypothetical protein
MDGDAQILEESAEGEKTAESAERTRRGGEEQGGLADKGDERRFVVALGPAAPVDRVFQQSGIATVVLGAGKDEAVRRAEESFQALRGIGHAFGVLKVLIEERQLVVVEIDEGDFGSSGGSSDGGGSEDGSVERAAPGTAGESDKLRRRHWEGTSER